VIGLIGDIAWPLTVVLILVILRREFKAIHKALQTRIGDPHTPVKLTAHGLELSSRVEVLEGKAETQELKAEVVASAVVATRIGPQQAERIPQSLFTLRAEYIAADDESDHMRRIQKKNDLARSMGAEVLRTDIDRRTLVDQGDEVMTLALAGAVTALPQSGDDLLILTAGRRIERLHTQSHPMEDLISSYRKSADSRLIRRIDWTLQVLRNYDGKESSG
jgi:hypothetical protein